MQTPNPLGSITKIKSPWPVIMLALFIIYVLVTQLGPASGLESRVSRLEAAFERLDNVPLSIATQTEAITTLKTSVDKLGEKLDRHIQRDTR